MKHLKKLLIILTISLSIYLIYINTNKNQIDYLTLGDSYAKGINPYNQESYGYSEYLKDYLIKENTLNTYNKSLTTENETIESLLNKIKANNSIKQTIRESDLITLSIGLNDIIYSLSKTPNPTTTKLEELTYIHYQNFEKLLEEILKYTNKPIYVISYNETLYTDEINYSIEKLNNYYELNTNIIFIPYPKELENIQKYYPNPNNTHPNEQGYNLIYQEILKKYLINN